MDFSTAFQYFTEDDTWKRKFGVAALLGTITMALALAPTYLSGADPTPENAMIVLSLSMLTLPIVLILAFLLSGYSIDISRNVRDGEKQPLPEWAFGHQVKQGAKISIASFIYLTPFMFLALCVATIAFVSLSSGGGTSPTPPTPPDLTSSPVFLVTGIFTMLFTFFMAALQVNYIRHNTFASCFKLGNIKFIIKKRWKKLMLMALFVGVISLITGGITHYMTQIGFWPQFGVSMLIALLVSPLLMFVQGHLYGQIASLVDLDKLNEADQV